jgi:DNA-binding transcriptional LysR family regulator
MLLTPEGELLLEKAISLFEIIKEMKSEVCDTHLEQRGRVSLASSHAIVQFFLPKYVCDFRTAHPHVEFSIEGGGLEMILERIESGEADFGIAHLHEIPDTVSYHGLFETGRMLIAPKKNPFGLKGKLTLKQISETPFIFFPYSMSLRAFTDKRFSDSGVKLKLTIVLNNFNSIKKYVAMGLGVSILDDYTLTKMDHKRFDIFSLDRFFRRRTYGLIIRKRKYLTPAAKAFVHTIKPDIQF